MSETVSEVENAMSITGAQTWTATACTIVTPGIWRKPLRRVHPM